MKFVAEGTDIDDLSLYEGDLEEGEQGIVFIDLDTILTQEDLEDLQDDMTNRGAIICSVNQESTGRLHIVFENRTPVAGVGFIGVLTLIALSVSALVLVGVGLFGWTLWSALSKTPWWAWWGAAMVGGYFTYQAFVKTAPGIAKTIRK